MPICLRAGVSIFDFWNYTLAEITLILKDYQDREKQRAKEVSIISYNRAQMIADFVSLRLNGKTLPSYNKLFPDAENKEATQAQKERDYKAMMLQKEQ